jgi:ribonuclease HI
VGGVIFSPGGTIRLTFSWSLGTTTNNQVEAYALLQGLLLAQQQGLDSISILGDSKVVINHVRKKTLPLDMKLRTFSQESTKRWKLLTLLSPSMFFVTTMPMWIFKPIRLSTTKWALSK